MTETVTVVGAIVAAAYVVYNLFFRFRIVAQDSQVLDLTAKIEENKAKLATAKKEADASLETYEQAKKRYDSTHDSDGNPRS